MDVESLINVDRAIDTIWMVEGEDIFGVHNAPAPNSLRSQVPEEFLLLLQHSYRVYIGELRTTRDIKEKPPKLNRILLEDGDQRLQNTKQIIHTSPRVSHDNVLYSVD